ncbi:MAG: SinR family protein [Anaerolineaceae bacterium]|nr:SinR family protein [Anaerolineaceae bacterium]
MSSYMVGYDLNKPGQDYTELHDAIKAYDNWWHYLDSTWIIVTEDSAATVRDNLKAHIDSGDELLVAKLSGEAAWTGFVEKGSTWLKNNL